MKTKKLLSAILILSLFCTLFSSFSVMAAKKDEYVKGDLIINGDMEVCGTSFAQWSGIGAGSSRVSTAIKRNGDRAAKLTAKDGTKQIIQQDINGLIPGKKYVYSAYLYVEELLDFSKDIGGIMKIEFYKADGYLSTTSFDWGCFVGQQNKWTLCTVEGIAPDETVSAKIQLRLDSGGTIYWDDASFEGPTTPENLEEITNQREKAKSVFEHSEELVRLEQEKVANTQMAPGAKNMVKNASFETPAESGDHPEGWSGWRGVWGGVTSYTNEDAHTGQYSVKIFSDSTSNYLPFVSHTITENLVANKEYMLSAWVKAKDMAALKGALMKIECYSSAATSAGTNTGNTDTNTFVLEDGVWTQIKHVFTLPENTTAAIIYIRSTGLGTLYYDDIEFGPTGSSTAMTSYTKDAFYYTEDEIIEAFADIDYINHPIEDGSTVTFTIKDGDNVIAERSVPAAPSVKAEFDVMTLAEKTKPYTITMAYKKADGTVIEESEPKRIYRYDRPTALNEKGEYLDENGEPIDVMFLYGAYEELFDEYAKAGITVIRPDEVRFDRMSNAEEIRHLMDAAHEHGLKVLFALYGRAAGHPFQIPTTRALVTEFKDHPALYAWMMLDEPCYNTGVGEMAQTYTEMLEYLEEGYRVIREIDPVHPVYNIESTGVPNSYELAFQYVDIAAIDPYPSAKSNRTYRPYAGAVRAVNAVYDEKEVWSLGYADKWVANWDLEEDDYRMNLYIMAWGGAEGLGFYLKESENGGLELNKKLLPVLTKMNETGELHQIYDHFVRKNSPVFSEYMGIDYWMRSWIDGEKMYVLVKDHKDDGNPTSVNFNLISSNGLIEINGYEATLVNGTTAKTVSSADSSFSLTLNPGQISLYEIALDSSFDISLLDEPMYTDLGNHTWAEEAIEEITVKGIANNKGVGIYAPGENITRGDFAMYLIRALGLTADTTDQFTDVDPAAPYAKEVAIGKALGILKGSGDGTYNPEEPISRQDLMVICARGLRSLNSISTVNPDEVLKNFSDTGLIADYALEDIASMVASRIITGNADLTINPLGNTTRAEAAVIMSRMSK